MGVRNLNRCLKRKCSAASIRAMKLEELRGKTIAVDISIYMYKFEQFNSLLENMYVMLALFEKHGIRPCFVFDGKPPPEKQEILNARKQEREQAYQNYAELSQQLQDIETGDADADDVDLIFQMDPEPESDPPAAAAGASTGELEGAGVVDAAGADAVDVVGADGGDEDADADAESKKQTILSDMEKLKKQMVRITKTKVDAVKSLLTAYGAAHMTAEGEADELCASLVVYGKAWACISEDMDLFVYGCPRVLRYFSLVHQTAVLYDLALMLNDLQMTHTEFREICILAGTDYSVSLQPPTAGATELSTEPAQVPESEPELEPEPEPEPEPKGNGSGSGNEEAEPFQVLLRLFNKYATEMEHTTNMVVRQIPLAFSHWLHSNRLYSFDLAAAKKVYDLFHVKWNETLNQTVIPEIAFCNNSAKIMEIMSSQRFLFYEYASPTASAALCLSPPPPASAACATGEIENRYLTFSGTVLPLTGLGNKDSASRKHAHVHAHATSPSLRFPAPWTTIAAAGAGANEGNACQLSQLLKKSKKERTAPAPERYTVKASKPAKYRTPTYTKTAPANSPW